MKRIKSVEAVNFRGQRYLRVWQYAARGGKSLAIQVRLNEGQKAGDAFNSEAVQSVLRDEFETRLT